MRELTTAKVLDFLLDRQISVVICPDARVWLLENSDKHLGYFWNSNQGWWLLWIVTFILERAGMDSSDWSETFIEALKLEYNNLRENHRTGTTLYYDVATLVPVGLRSDSCEITNVVIARTVRKVFSVFFVIGLLKVWMDQVESEMQ